MLSDEIRARLAQLLTHPATTERPPNPAPIADAPRAMPPAEADPLGSAEVRQNASGEHLCFSRPLESLWPGVGHALPGGGARLPPRTMHPELAAVYELFPHGTLFLDLETCGFAGASIFLAGLVRYRDGELTVEQLFARHYNQERALLETLWQIASEHRVLVTFNGKSFDWPMVHDRSTRHHLGRDLRGQRGASGSTVAVVQRSTASGEVRSPAAPLGRHDARPELVHCDLLHHARRRWRRQLPNCKLQTLERYACRRWRHDDLSVRAGAGRLSSVRP